MALGIQPYKGARDFYPQDKRLQKWLFGILRQTVEKFGYQEYDAPFLEPFDIFAAKSGDELVNEQLYSFEDRGGRKVAIRPEMTPSVSRMVAARRQELPYPLRWYSIPNLWRYERPQRGRSREHYQLNVDIFGVEGIEADAEVIQIADAILKALGAKPGSYKINVNSRLATVQALKDIGIAESELKAAYKLVDKMPKLDKNEFDALLAEQLGADRAAKLRQFLEGQEPPPKIRQLLDVLKAANVETAVYEPSVVRGLDYYTDIVFEVFDTDPKNPRALLGGGRYDGLVELFGAEPLPVVGFGMGDVTLLNFLEGHGLLPALETEVEAVAILIGDVYEAAQPVLETLRGKLNLAVDMTGRKLDKKIQSADKAGVANVIFVGEEEIKSQSVRVKNLASGEEKTVPLSEYTREV
ncbi:histidine--tRNA ligase [Candidatus Saccharibacteria bacterium]|nr:histidine--tRNA ligase [Candidatus Saccharibacteria bacterium]